MKRHPTVATVFLALLFVLTAGLSAQTPAHYVVSRAEGSVVIPFSTLIDGGPDAPEIVSWIGPSRGTIVETADSFVYTSDPAFHHWGSDNFRFTYVDVDTEDLREMPVHLIADLGPDNLTYPDEGNSDGKTTSGGNTVLELDIGPCQGCGTEPQSATILAQTQTQDCSESSVGYTVWRLVDGSGVVSFRVDARQHDGSVVQTELIARRQAQKLVLDWWLASARAPDGGILVRRDDTLVAALVGLDNHQLGLTWRCPVPAGPEAPVLVNITSYERETVSPLAYPSRFADTFEEGATAGWLPRDAPWTGPKILEVNADAAVDGRYGLAVDISGPQGGEGLIDTRPQAEDNFRARFHLDTGLDCSGALAISGGSVNLLRGQTAAFQSVFELTLERAAWGGYQLRATSFDDGSFDPTTRTVAITEPQVTIEVTWWAASQPGTADGGVFVRLDEGSDLTELELALANVNQRIDAVRFGAFEATPGATGTICLDEFESWWR